MRPISAFIAVLVILECLMWDFELLGGSIIPQFMRSARDLQNGVLAVGKDIQTTCLLLDVVQSHGGTSQCFVCIICMEATGILGVHHLWTQLMVTVIVHIPAV